MDAEHKFGRFSIHVFRGVTQTKDYIMNDDLNTPDPKKSMPRPLDPLKDFKYDLGYAEPPKDTRYKPGQSGNPDGRPPGSKNKPKVLNNILLTEMMREEYSRPVEAKDRDEVESIPLIRSILRKRYRRRRM